MTLFTNQYFHNGVWGELHNKSVRPVVEISDVKLKDGKLSFTVFRVEGVDVYGSFLIGIRLKDQNGKILMEKNGEALSQFPSSAINNYYVTKVAPGKHSLIIPLGSKAGLTLDDDSLQNLPKGTYQLILTDISGVEWTSSVNH